MTDHSQSALKTSSDRLDSWKEIAAYLGRSERTVRRWEEKEELPVHRLVHEKRGSVFASRSEIDAWVKSRASTLTEEPVAAEPAVAPLKFAPEGRRRRLQLWAAAAAGVALLAAAAYGFVARTAAARDRAAVPSWYSGNPEAYRAYLRGSGFGVSYSRSRVRAAIQGFEEAIHLNGGFVRAYAGLAQAHVGQTWSEELPARDTLSQARKVAARLHEIDPNFPIYWKVEGTVLEWLDLNYAKAEEFHLKAIQIDPANPIILRGYAEFLLNVRRFDEAIMWSKRAFDLDPSRPIEGSAYSIALYFNGRTDEAFQTLRQFVDYEPNAAIPRIYLGRIYLDRGQFDEAVEQIKRADDLVGQVPFTRAELARALALSGRSAEAAEILEEMNRKRGAGYYPAFAFATAYSALGQPDRTLDWLARAVEERNTGWYSMNADPIYNPLRSHPRFQELLREMKYPVAVQTSN